MVVTQTLFILLLLLLFIRVVIVVCSQVVAKHPPYSLLLNNHFTTEKLKSNDKEGNMWYVDNIINTASNQNIHVRYTPILQHIDCV